MAQPLYRSHLQSISSFVAPFALTAGLVVGGIGAAHAEDAETSAAATYADVQATVGGVPTFVKMFPKAGVAGAWQEAKGLLFGETALPAKTKALISLAVAAQIPCHYCVWSDTEDAKRAGATEEEIAEAVAVAALTRHWSTVFNGLQIDFDTYKQELSGNFSAQ